MDIAHKIEALFIGSGMDASFMATCLAPSEPQSLNTLNRNMI